MKPAPPRLPLSAGFASSYAIRSSRHGACGSRRWRARPPGPCPRSRRCRCPPPASPPPPRPLPLCPYPPRLPPALASPPPSAARPAPDRGRPHLAVRHRDWRNATELTIARRSAVDLTDSSLTSEYCFATWPCRPPSSSPSPALGQAVPRNFLAGGRGRPWRFLRRTARRHAPGLTVTSSAPRGECPSTCAPSWNRLSHPRPNVAADRLTCTVTALGRVSVRWGCC